jgi:hypothetical protein
MARCPSCQHELSALLYSFSASVLLRNMFRSPARRIFICRNCNEELMMTIPSFIFCQVAFIIIVIPCAIGFARLQTLLVNSTQLFHQLSKEYPYTTIVSLWILPTLIVTLFVYGALAKHFVEFKKAG